jgi:hypothetical protein
MVADNVSNNNALYRRLYKKGKINLLDGGWEIVRPLDYTENSTYQRYSGYDTLNISPSDVLTAANYAWKNAAIHVSASGTEIRNNSGKERIIPLVEARVKNALRTFANDMSTDVYSDGTASNQINGLQAIVADAGTGTVGGINSTTYTWWKNGVQSAAAPIQGGGAVTMGTTTIQTQMNNLWYQLTRGSDVPDIIVSSNDYYDFYEESLTQYKRYTTSDDAQGGFMSLKYKSADVFFDGGTKGGGVPASHMYFLNTDFLEICVHKDANLERLDDKISLNQDAVIIPFLWQGNLVCSNRSLQGVMKA